MSIKQHNKLHMKDSGIQWIGQVPYYWNHTKLRHLVNTAEKAAYRAVENNDKGKFNFYTSSQNIIKKHDKAIYDFEGLIFGTGGSASIHYEQGDFSTSADCLVLKKSNDEINFKFLYWYLKSQQSIINDLGFEGMGLKHLQKNFLFGLNIYFPSLNQQKQIAEFLDKKTQNIDQLIEKKEKLIQLLEEKKETLINDAVTKGLNKNAEMKDSGIGWIGEIPNNWTYGSLKRYSNKIICGPFGSSITKDMYISKGKHRVYGQEQVIPDDYTIGDYYITEEKYKSMDRYHVKPGDVLVSSVGTFGKISIFPENAEPGIINPRLINLSLKEELLSAEFLKYYVRSHSCLFQLSLVSRGGTMDIINVNLLSNLKVVIPPLKEQKDIVKKLDNQLQIIDNLISKVLKQIHNLKEYKEVLIFNAVTGKIEI